MLRNTRIKGSLSIEATLSLTLFIYASVIMIDIINMYAIKMHVQRAIYNTGLTVSKYYYAYEKLEAVGVDVRSLEDDSWGARLASSAFSSAVLKEMIKDELPAGFMKDKHLVGGSGGFNFFLSDVCQSDGDVDIVVSYKLKSPFDIFGLCYVNAVNRVHLRAYVGDEKVGSGGSVQYVYIAPNGEVYHEDADCTYIKPKLYIAYRDQIEDLRSEDGAKYYPCKGCCSPGITTFRVYYTKYGNRYHESKYCRLIKRGVIRIPITQVGDRRPCSKCCGK
ncbi:MAG: hypothetical protein K6F17_01900 [Lachnospiraceae bacterium]|nr:hypothetical protein [Lachnospiraceae bacterium]